MRRLLLVLVALAGVSCVDLTRPPELARAPTDLLDGEAPDAPSIEVGHPSSDAGGSAPDAALAPDQAAPADLEVPAPDAAAPPDLMILPDAALPPDAPSAPDVAADMFVGPPDLAPDRAPPPPDVAPDVAPDLPPPPPDVAPDVTPDLAPDRTPDVSAPPLVVDDFQGSSINRNTLGSAVSFDHETCAHVNGESVCTYSGTGGFHDFIESFNGFCAFDGSRFTKLRFRMRTSVAGQVVEIYGGANAGACTNETLSKIGTITTTTTMTTYDVELATINRADLVSIEFDPQSANASIQFILDDIQLVP
jgi:hypothetical protein